jgi:hypothetical protein
MGSGGGEAESRGDSEEDWKALLGECSAATGGRLDEESFLHASAFLKREGGNVSDALTEYKTLALAKRKPRLLSTEDWTRLLFKHGGNLDHVRRESGLQSTDMKDLVEEYYSVWMREITTREKGDLGWAEDQLTTFAKLLVQRECNVFKVLEKPSPVHSPAVRVLKDPRELARLFFVMEDTWEEYCKLVKHARTRGVKVPVPIPLEGEIPQWREDVKSWLSSWRGDKNGSATRRGGRGGGGKTGGEGEGIEMEGRTRGAGGGDRSKRRRWWMSQYEDVPEMMSKAMALHPNLMKQMQSHNSAPGGGGGGGGSAGAAGGGGGGGRDRDAIGGFVSCPLCDAKISVEDIRSPDADVETHIDEEH